MVSTAQAPARPRPRRSRLARVLHAAGWTLIAAGTVVLLYLVYSLVFTGFETRRAQAELFREFQGPAAAADAGGGTGAAASPAPSPEGDSGPATPSGQERGAPVPGDAVALLEFRRPGGDERPVRDDTLVVVDGVGVAELRVGPGRYPDTALPGEEGNFAVAGHRTTYGAPFFRLDELRAGDEVRVTDRARERHVYRVVDTEVVAPSDVWVIGPDPLGTGRTMLTLTTCHPRFSAAERLVVFAELVTQDGEPVSERQRAQVRLTQAMP